MYYDLGLHKLVNKERVKRKYQLCWKSKDLKTVYYVGVKIDDSGYITSVNEDVPQYSSDWTTAFTLEQASSIAIDHIHGGSGYGYSIRKYYPELKEKYYVIIDYYPTMKFERGNYICLNKRDTPCSIRYTKATNNRLQIGYSTQFSKEASQNIVEKYKAIGLFTHMKKVSIKDRARKIRKEELYSNDK